MRFRKRKKFSFGRRGLNLKRRRGKKLGRRVSRGGMRF